MDMDFFFFFSPGGAKIKGLFKKIKWTLIVDHIFRKLQSYHHNINHMKLNNNIKKNPKPCKVNRIIIPKICKKESTRKSQDIIS